MPPHWDGRGFGEAFRAGRSDGRDYVVFGQNCWACQRSVRWDDHVFIRTYHTGLKELPARMTFNVADDPHELNDLTESRPELADHGQALIEQWTAEMLATSDYATDPMWTVMREGGPYHCREIAKRYLPHLRSTGRAHHADFLEAHPTGLAEGV
ncbi:hypothetical protein LCGC14_3000140 [marine sediment metagenome]|uniref:Sulfatase N-terminal domain-containing protein n=1 Tax=marine sediment metagenome TaxID=412755 RepID=A0A0F8X1T4_9ZZZZ